MEYEDREREAALDTAAAAYARGALSEQSYETVRKALVHATDAGSIRRVLSDYQLATGRAPRAGAGAGSGSNLVAILGQRNADRGILANRFVSATAVMGSLSIDLRGGSLAADCTINIFALMAEVTIFVPDGVPVTNNLSAILAEHRDASAKNRPHVTTPSGEPRLTIGGLAVMAEVRIRN